jgi:carboxypeptidase Q
MRRLLAVALSMAVALPLLSSAQQPIDLSVVDRIKTEAFAHSEVMEHLRQLTDIHGPRLTASPEFDDAANWATERLRSFGVANVHTEKWPFGRSWSLQEASVEQLTPRYAPLTAVPLAWSASTRGPVTGDVILAPLATSFFAGPKKLATDLDAYTKAWAGKLRGRIVLLTRPKAAPAAEQAAFRRLTDKDLAEIAQAPEPFAKRDVKLEDLEWPDTQDPKEIRAFFRSLPEDLVDELYFKIEDVMAARAAFLSKEGVAAVLLEDPRAQNGMLFAEAAGSFKAKDVLAPPTFVVTGEQYNRLARLAQHGQPARVRVNLKAAVSERDVEGANVVGEIPGGAKKDEVVMIGAHFDSWHAGTGATDNGAGSAVMMEVMRILKALDLKLDRTVRIGLWGGEEQGYYGSRAYVKAHFGDVKTMQLLPEHEKLSVYFNLDNGSGKIRGVYLQQHEAMRPFFQAWLAPFRDLGVTTISIQNTGGTDHVTFNAVGLPGFQFIQDPLDYSTVTHHSDLDVYDHAVEADLMQAAAVIAAVVYGAANAPERMPRREMPKSRPFNGADGK